MEEGDFDIESYLDKKVVADVAPELSSEDVPSSSSISGSNDSSSGDAGNAK